MATKQSLDEWARTTTVPDPPQWGELEAALVARTPRPRFGASDLLAPVILALVAGLCFSAWIGLAIVATNAEPDVAMPDLASLAATIAFIAAIVTAGVTLESWRDGMRRSMGALCITGGNGAASVIAYVLVRPATEEWVGLLAAISAVANLGMFVAILVRSTPGHRTRLPVLVRARTAISPPNELHYFQARNGALEVLTEREAVTLDADTHRDLLKKPLGSWHDLDRVSARPTP